MSTTSRPISATPEQVCTRVQATAPALKGSIDQRGMDAALDTFVSLVGQKVLSGQISAGSDALVAAGNAALGRQRRSSTCRCANCRTV